MRHIVRRINRVWTFFVFCRKELHADNHSIHEPTASGDLPSSHKGHSGRTAGAAKWVPNITRHVISTRKERPNPEMNDCVQHRGITPSQWDETCGPMHELMHRLCYGTVLKNGFNTPQCTKTAFEELQARSARGKYKHVLSRRLDLWKCLLYWPLVSVHQRAFKSKPLDLWPVLWFCSEWNNSALHTEQDTICSFFLNLLILHFFLQNWIKNAKQPFHNFHSEIVFTFAINCKEMASNTLI